MATQFQCQLPLQRAVAARTVANGLNSEAGAINLTLPEDLLEIHTNRFGYFLSFLCLHVDIISQLFQTTAKEASRKCKLEAQGADLAMMPTPFHNAFVATMLTNRAWIGITTDTEKGVHFTWIDQRFGSCKSNYNSI